MPLLKVRTVIQCYIKNHNSKLILEEFLVFGENKVEALISSDTHMLSVSIIKDLTCDMFIGRISDEEIVFNVTEKPRSSKEVFCKIELALHKLELL